MATHRQLKDNKANHCQEYREITVCLVAVPPRQENLYNRFRNRKHKKKDAYFAIILQEFGVTRCRRKKN